jgi:hypothetical protein
VFSVLSFANSAPKSDVEMMLADPFDVGANLRHGNALKV